MKSQRFQNQKNHPFFAESNVVAGKSRAKWLENYDIDLNAEFQSQPCLNTRG
jgi:hypothetical protein